MVVVQVSVGHRAEVVAVVTDDDTAIALGSGSLPVLATPRLLGWCEAATCAALEGHLRAGWSSVGTSVRLEHIAPSPVGEQLRVDAVVNAVDGRRVRLEVTATDVGGRVVGRGTVERVVVDDHRFLGRLEKRS